MLIFGSRGNVIDLGEVQTHHCPVCERERPFHIVLQYRYWHVWFLFALVTTKVYVLSCTVCGRGTQLKPAEAEGISVSRRSRSCIVGASRCWWASWPYSFCWPRSGVIRASDTPIAKTREGISYMSDARLYQAWSLS